MGHFGVKAVASDVAVQGARLCIGVYDRGMGSPVLPSGNNERLADALAVGQPQQDRGDTDGILNLRRREPEQGL